MKKILFAFAIIALAFTGFIQKQEPVNNVSPDEMVMEKSFYDFKMKDINGQEVDFSQFKGKKLLLVNVASKCGYTKQYEDLQKLHQEHGDEVTIIGFPANNFGGQEPGTNEEIKEFCSSKFGVTFMMMDKISVKGDDKAPLYKWLSDKDLNGWNDKEPTWNFCKYFINEKGELVKFFASSVKPMDEEILKLIAE
ncbi:glutathione peroxidase [Cognataquiflexum rubidum]|jgi:glutathione peroxidase|uniref:glutathione peroxidase n=1 Tax=Cognataquiflexum rubidum TaxID=2922273 RepID=UPI001F129D3E|nr:glutathione peroxidase [Cognataquiflexum rubidum]MCH6233314.1 glutathione peroxidase [Cognataquiflexum rubidum]